MENEFEGISSLPKLKDAATYVMWQFQINILLKSCGLYKIATGEEKCPENDKEEWEQKDAKVKRIILCTIEQNIMTLLIDCEDGFSMLKLLKNLFESVEKNEKRTIQSENQFEVILNLPKLNDTATYLVWQFHINVFLKSYGLDKIASGEEKCPENNSDEWERKDAKVKRIILSTVEVDQNVLTHILMCKDGFGMLKYLKNLFGTKRDNEDQKLNMLLKFNNWQWSKLKSAADNFAKINSIVIKLKILNEDVTMAMLTAKFLAVLPENYLSLWERMPKEERTVENLTTRSEEIFSQAENWPLNGGRWCL